MERAKETDAEEDAMKKMTMTVRRRKRKNQLQRKAEQKATGPA